MERTISVLIADDHPIIRSTVERRLVREPDLRVVALAGTAGEAVDRAIQTSPDVVLLDVAMPGLAAFDAARTILSRLPEAKLIFLTGHTGDETIDESLRAGASGFLGKDSDPDDIVAAVRAVGAGGTWFSPEIEARLVVDRSGVRLRESLREPGPLDALTTRERQVVRYLSQGLSKREIAGLMHVSVKTVDNHATSVMTKLDIHDRVALARFAFRHGIAEP
ncbi:MAG: response regulator transcription factor [Phycisphaeraceae bacterium]|nr:response regulator transcription factor [Phycisphaeraceae bacterium]